MPGVQWSVKLWMRWIKSLAYADLATFRLTSKVKVSHLIGIRLTLRLTLACAGIRVTALPLPLPKKFPFDTAIATIRISHQAWLLTLPVFRYGHYSRSPRSPSDSAICQAKFATKSTKMSSAAWSLERKQVKRATNHKDRTSFDFLKRTGNGPPRLLTFDTALSRRY
jgi:hypothetical protein